MQEKLKILYINAMGPTTKCPQGGVFITQRIKALKSLGVKVIAHAFSMQYSKNVNKWLKRKGINTNGDAIGEQLGVSYVLDKTKFNMFDLALAKIFPYIYTVKIYYSLRQAIATDEKIDIIHLHWVWPTGLGVCKLAKKMSVPYVVTCHGSDVNFTMCDKKINSLFVKILEEAASVEFVSRALLETAIKNGYSGKNAEVVYNGIDTNVFKGGCDCKREKIVGYVGNLISVKGADRLVPIITAIHSRCADVKFLVVGSGSLEQQLKEQMRGLPVKFTGQLTPKELKVQYEKMNVLLVPSRAEGYSCVTKEAQACGVIPVGNDVGGIREAIGNYGIIITEKSEEKLIENFVNETLRCLNGEASISREKMMIQARKCSWVNRQMESLRIYNEIMKDARGSIL